MSLYREKGFPHKGWRYSYEEDLEDVTGECEVCGHRLRFAHHLVHSSYIEIVVGCQCCEKLLDPISYITARTKEQQMRKNARRKEKKTMKPFNGYKEEVATGSKSLPVGSYVVEVKNVKFVQGNVGQSDRLELLIDVAEGTQAGFFAKKYNDDTNEDKKWAGRATIWIPSEDGSDNDKRAMRTFNSVMAWFADANAGYHWNWEESTLKGKKIGATFRKEWNKADDGREFFYTAFAWFCSVDDVRKGTARSANEKFRNGATGKQNNQAAKDELSKFTSVNPDALDEIPFD